MALLNLCLRGTSKICSSSYLRHFSSSVRRYNHYDVIITGGGMVGSAMAATLGHNQVFKDKKVLLLESGPQAILETPPEKYSSRVCALSNATKSLLSGFGAWDNILRLREVRYMRVWDACSDVGIVFDTETLPQDSPDLAYIVENDLIVSAILKQLLKSNIEVRFNSKVKSYSLRDNSTGNSTDSNSIQLENGEVLSSELLIGADGMNSMLRKSANISTINWLYHQKAVVATVKLTGGLENRTAWQRFLPNGPIALLPLSDDFSCLIWTTTHEQADELMKMTPEVFVESINTFFNSDLYLNSYAAELGKTVENVLMATGLGERTYKQFPPRIEEVNDESRKTFPLSLVHSTDYVGRGVVLIGDAAHRVHPLSGQGVNLGFGDVSCLAEVLEETILRGGDIGCVANLKAFETRRQRRVLPMMATIDVLDRLYSNDAVPLVALRSIGCQVANSVPFIKEKMVSFASN